MSISKETAISYLKEILEAADDEDEERLAWVMQMARAELSGGFGDESPGLRSQGVVSRDSTTPTLLRNMDNLERNYGDAY